MVNLTLTEFKNLGDENNITYGFILYDSDGNNTYYNPYHSKEELYEESLDDILDIIGNNFSEYFEDIELKGEFYINDEIIDIHTFDKNITLRDLCIMEGLS